jgi:predicted transcriptional regulator
MQLSSDFYMDRQLSFETITNSVRNVLTYRPTGFDIELFRLSDDPHRQARFERRKTETIPGADLVADIPTAEDVIIQKLRWQRDKDISDARNVIHAQLDNLDWDYLHRWTDEHGTTELLEQLRNEAI